MGEKIRITYFRSAIGRQQIQKDTVRALGFRRLNQTLEKPDNPSIRGMVRKIQHLVRIEEDENGVPANRGANVQEDEHENETE